ncbi:MAG: DOMON-like domain-containing protein [Cyanobacteria bacterium J06634_5]
MTHTAKSFSLQPFQPTPLTTDVTITGHVLREGPSLTIDYLISGNWKKVVIAESNLGNSAENDTRPNDTGPNATGPKRCDRLWEKTCFEFFIAQGTTHDQQQPYWEFNMAPSGDWNVFALNSYRQGLREETAIANLPFAVHSAPDGLHLSVTLNIAELITSEASTAPLQLGVSMVVLLRADTTEEGKVKGKRNHMIEEEAAEEGAVKETFWAIAHPAPQADFHHPKSLSLQL